MTTLISAKINGKFSMNVLLVWVKKNQSRNEEIRIIIFRKRRGQFSTRNYWEKRRKGKEGNAVVVVTSFLHFDKKEANEKNRQIEA